MARSRSSGRRLSSAELHVALALAEGPAHGYLLMQRVNDLGQGIEVGAATMYRTLRKMLADNLVVQSSQPHHDARRRPYQLTESGLRALIEEGHRMVALVGEAVASGIPERFHTITPQLVVTDANDAIAFYCEAFAAREVSRTHHKSGRIQHAEIVIGDSLLLLHDDFSDLGGPTAAASGCSGVTIHLYLTDADATFQRAITAGARSILPIADQPWGDRYGIVEDPFGHRWSIGHRNPPAPIAP